MPPAYETAFATLRDRWHALTARHPGIWGYMRDDMADEVANGLINYDDRLRVIGNIAAFREGRGNFNDSSDERMRFAVDLGKAFAFGRAQFTANGRLSMTDLFAIRALMTETTTPADKIILRQNYTYDHKVLGYCDPQQIPMFLPLALDRLNNTPDAGQPFDIFIQFAALAPFEHENERFAALMLALCLERMGLMAIVPTSGERKLFEWALGSLARHNDRTAIGTALFRSIETELTYYANLFPSWEGFATWIPLAENSLSEPSLIEDCDYSQYPPPLDQYFPASEEGIDGEEL